MTPTSPESLHADAYGVDDAAEAHIEALLAERRDDPCRGLCLFADAGRVCHLRSGHEGDCDGPLEHRHEAEFKRRERLRELAALLRSPENSDALRELLELVFNG